MITDRQTDRQTYIGTCFAIATENQHCHGLSWTNIDYIDN